MCSTCDEFCWEKMIYFIEGVLFKVDEFSFSHLLNFSSISVGARPPWNRLNHAREGGGGLPQWQLQGALQHHGGEVHIREEIGFLNFLLCWLFLHFVGWLRRMFGNGYVISIAIDLLRSFDACYHAELQDMWYKAHYKEAEKIRARPLGEYKVFGFLTFGRYVRRLQREKRMKNELLFIASINARVILNLFKSL